MMTTNKTLSDFSFRTVKSIEFGVGISQTISEKLACLEAKRPLIITDSMILQLGLLAPTLSSLEQSGAVVHIYSGVEPDPKDEQVLAAVECAISNGCDSIIGFGGGSPMDVAKLVAVLAAPQSSKLDLASMYGVEQFKSDRLPLLQVPTTAGTGSEVTAVAIVTTGNTTKAGVVSPILYADQVLLDPELTVGLPPHATAATGIDAMVHAIEAYTSKRLKNPMSDSLALQALDLMSQNISLAVNTGTDIQARGKMLYAAMLAGQAFSNSPVGGVHALAYPLGGLFHVAHGLSNSLVLPHVLRFNNDAADKQYSELASVILQRDVATDGGHLLADYFVELAASFSIPTSLKEVGVKESDIEKLAEHAMLQERLLVNNPKQLLLDDALDIYSKAF